MARGGRQGDGGDDIDHQSAKHLLDSIGKIVHDKAKNGGAETYKDELKGYLHKANGNEELVDSLETCKLVDDYYNNHVNGNSERHPCKKDGTGKEEVNRFSDKEGAECDNRKIDGNIKSGNGTEVGACAPYRRLYLCNKNIVKMDTNNNDGNAKHNLLAEVCMAAKYEGQTITRDYPLYQQKYPDSPSQLCTELARSFADIGDIVRGRDLYRGRGRRKGKAELQENMRKIFAKIYNDVTSGKTNKEAAKKRYNDDTENYYQLREDWWDANRETVWKAMTCDDDNKLSNSSYFRQTCNDNETFSHANHKCRCRSKKGTNETDQVPTYFDYVPQYLRWFEEWGEDFCRKKKKKLENVQKQCRGEYQGEERYCSRNGYDCEKTVNARGKVRMGKGCTDCFFACNPYIDWINNQKEQFDKQRKKYQNEISVNSKRRQDTTGNNYERYEKKFYEELKKHGYETVEKFLEKLSAEEVCKKIDDEEGGKINFKEVNSGDGTVRAASGDASGTNDENKGTFYRSKYCQPCPLCGVQNKGNKEWKEKNDGRCKRGNLYKPRSGATPTDNTILKSGENHDDIKQKIDDFCAQTNGDTTNSDPVVAGNRGGRNSNSSLYDPWQCYEGKDVEKVKDGNDEDDEDEEDYQNIRKSGGLCILKNKKEKESKSDPEPNDIQKTFNDFFYYWVAHMLKDSIYWRTKKIKSCISNGKKTCLKKCKDDCECFEKWVGQKKKEWDKIKEHFYKQEDFKNEKGRGLSSGLYVLEHNLKLQFFNEDTEEDTENSLDAQEAEELKHIRDIIGKKNQEEEVAGTNGKKTIMDKLIEHEEKDAKQCIEKHTCPPPEDTSRGRSLPPAGGGGHDSDDDDDDEEHVDDHQQQQEEEELPPEEEAEAPTTQDEVKPCDIVAELFSNTTKFSDACKLKYGPGGKERYSQWKCVPTSGGGDNTTTERSRVARSADGAPGKSGGDKDGATGGLCIPPRRRKLYLGRLSQWASVETTQAKSPPLDVGASTETPQSSLLRDAFIQSAAIETFFLWDRYKKMNTPQGSTDGARGTWGSVSGYSGADYSNDSLFRSGGNGMKAVAPVGAGPHIPSGVSSGGGLLPLPPHGEGVDGVPGAIPGIAGMPGGLAGARLPGSLGENSLSPIPLSPVPGLDGDSNDPENQLKRGNIPIDFLRLMFYTLADYRDILFGNTDIVIKGSSQEDKKAMEKIKENIEKILPKNGTHPPPGAKNHGQTPKDWWNENAKHIWEGMICALTYKESDAKGISTPLEQNEQVQQAFFGTPNGTYESTYKYDKVELKEDESTEGAKPYGGPRTSESSPTSDTPTLLSHFVKRPPYFRYLEEWGQNFCKERKKRLELVKDNCRNSERAGHHYCSGDGHDCTENGNLKHKDISADLYCPDCYEQCRKYRKWIDIKFVEYHKQQSIYQKELEKLNGNSSGDDDNKKYYQELKEKNTSAKFLKELKHCKPGDDDGDPDNKINFENPETMFGPLKYCKTCPPNKVNCSSGSKSRRSGGTNGCNVNVNGNTWEKIFSENGENSTTINVHMIDRRGPFIEEYLKKSKTLKNSFFKESRLFKSVRDQNWECRYKDENTNVCYLKNFEEKIDLNKYTTFKVFLVYWLQDFIEGYYILKKKKIFEQCTKNGENTCDKEPKNGCACVKKWVEQKKEEWGDIKKHFKKQTAGEGYDIVYTVKMFLETLIPQMDLVNNKGKINDLSTFLKSYGCNCNNNSEKEGAEDANKKDIVECLLDKIEKNAKNCPNQANGENEAQCENSSPFEDDDEEDLLLEENEKNEKTNIQPGFCPPTPAQPEETEETCTPADEKVEEEPEEPAEEPTEEPAAETKDTKEEGPSKPAAAPRPKRTARRKKKPKNVLDHPAVIPSLASSTLMWSVGIGFAALTYWWLKKKSKPPVDLLRVLNIPKGDYDIPTLKSSNRYIPYGTDKYRGKRYIYVEGDTDEDKYMFMSDTTDVTSSESEYEELDINEIYPYQSPKYKTLIEVVLEPSKRDIPSSDTPMNKFTDNEWNQLKHDFISQYLPNIQPNDYTSGNIPLNTQPNTLYFDKPEEKPFIMSIHDRNLYSGEEISYNMSTNSGENNLYSGQNNVYSGIDPTSDNRGPYSDKNDRISDNHHPYSGIDLINDALNGDYDIYDEILKRKENELFGTKHHTKHTNTYNVAKPARDDPITNQINLFHKWLDRHRNICEEWDKNKVELLDELKKEWNKENSNNGDKTYNSDNKPSHNHVLNTDVSIQIDMDNPKPKNEFTNMDTNPDKSTKDTILHDLEKYNEPYYYDFYEDDIYYDVNDDKASVDHINMDHNKMDNNNSDVPTKVQIEMNVINNQELLQNEYPISHM
ncbi:erythrocyte membrane protein 1, PfEMP1 [Plasmodium sp. gorilla clade G1]|nr:erythrocyte membrane protein 1, PfEMP1 [Plasmodium sp. gorilla clade G1]